MTKTRQTTESMEGTPPRFMDTTRNYLGSIFRKIRPPVLVKYVGSVPTFFRMPVVSPRLVWRRDALITRKTIRLVEKESIRDFVAASREYLRGRVLDFGAGEQPYKDCVEGAYVPFEKGETFPEGRFDAVLMNQVAQYLEDPLRVLMDIAGRTTYLVMTYPTHWEEVEETDLWRFTKAGMERLLRETGWEVILHEPRHAIVFDDFRMVIGYGVIAKSTRRPG